MNRTIRGMNDEFARGRQKFAAMARDTRWASRRVKSAACLLQSSVAITGA